MIIAINQLAILVSLPFVINQLGLNQFGKLAIGLYLIQLTIMITDWGFGYHSIEIFKKKPDKNLINIYLSKVVLIKIVLIFLLILVFYLFFLFEILNYNKLVFHSFLFSIIFSGLNPLWFFQALKIPNILILPTFFGRIIYIFLIFYLIRGIDNSHWFFIANGSSIFIISLFGYIYIYKLGYNISLPNIRKSLNLFIETSSYFFNSVFTQYSSLFWGLILGYVASPIQIGIFNIADQINRGLNTFSLIIPHAIRLDYADKPIKLIKFQFLSLLLLFILGAIFGYYLTPFVVKLLFEQSMSIAIPIIQIMIIAWCFTSISKIIAYPILGNILGMHKVNKYINYIGVFNLCFIGIWLINRNYEANIVVKFIFIFSLFELLFLLIMFISNIKKILK